MKKRFCKTSMAAVLLAIGMTLTACGSSTGSSTESGTSGNMESRISVNTENGTQVSTESSEGEAGGSTESRTGSNTGSSTENRAEESTENSTENNNRSNNGNNNGSSAEENHESSTERSTASNAGENSFEEQDPTSATESGEEAPQYAAGISNLSENVEKIKIPNTPMTKTQSAALSKSGEIMLQKVVELSKDKNGNYLISPISLQMALGMTATGSDKGSTTQKELMNVLLPGTGKDPSSLNKQMATFAKRMKNSKDVQWNVANSVWVNNNGEVKLRNSYVKNTTNYYAAELYAAPFDDSTVKAINDWVSKNTKKRIPKILNEISDDARIALVNALAFDAAWDTPYDKSQEMKNQTFTNSDGTKSKVTMLTSGEQKAIKLAGGLGFIKPYKGGQYSFVGILPPEGMSTDQYLKKIVEDKKSFAEAYQKADTSRDVHVKLPEFKVEYGVTMDDTLKALGIKVAYTDDAEFGAMVADDSEPVKIGTVIHKTMIDVSREGTKAAAATVVMIDKAGAFYNPLEPYEINLDRPFVYAIVDNETGVPVFLGVQNTMK